MLLRDQKLDILCLSETWLTAQVLDKFLSFPGYKIIRRDREGRRGGGVAILHRAEITAKPLAMPDSGPLESLWVSAVWRGGRHTTVGVIYRPPASPVSASLDALRGLLTAASGTGRPTFLLGDLNFDCESPNTRRYASVIEELNMRQLVDSPTHLQPTPSALDHVVTNQCDPPPVVSVLPDVISDHQPVVVTRDWAGCAGLHGGSWCVAGGGQTGAPSALTCCCLTGPR